jgi:transcriptional regulator with XRE-family HTH domain
MPSVRTDVVKRLRESKGWGQEMLAEKSITSLKTINSIESGAQARLSTIAKVARALGVEPGDLIDRGESPPVPQPPDPVPAGAVRADRRVELTLTLSIPFESFDETDGIDRLATFLAAVASAKKTIAITDLIPSSVKVSLLVDPDDAAAIVRAFAENKLEPIQASRLTVPRSLALSLLATSVASGVVNPLVVPVMPFAGLLLALMRLRQSGLDITFDDDGLTLRASGSPAETPLPVLPSVAAFDPPTIRQAVEWVTPEPLLPNFPCTVSLQLFPNEPTGPTTAQLGERLETTLSDHASPHLNVSRTDPAPQWDGKLAVRLESAAELRAAAELVLTSFLGEPVSLTVTQQRTGTLLGGPYTLDASVTTNLSAAVWESVERELAGLFPTA